MINTTKDRWSALSLRDRADLIKLYTDNGITNIKEIRKHYNSFGNGGETNKYEKESKSFLTNWYRNPTTQQMMGELDKTDYERFPVTAPSGATVTDPSLARRVKVNTALNTPSNYVEIPDDNLGRYLYNPTDASKNEVQVNKDFMNDVNSKFIFTHEYEHGIQYEIPFVLGTTQPVEHNLKPGVVEDPYLDSRKETRSRIMEAREFLNLDPSKRDYTPEEAAEFQKRLKEGKGYIGTASDLDRLTPETLADYLNYMADAQIDTNFSTYNNETVSYAKNGGKLNKFATGGPTEEGGYSKESLQHRKDIHISYDPTNRINAVDQIIVAATGGNNAKGEEDQYWRAYLGLANDVPKMNSKAKTSWDDSIEAEKIANGELPSDFYGTTPRMDLNIQAIADTLNVGKIYREYDKYKTLYPELPDEETIEEIYNTGKKVLNNPNTWQQVDGDNAAIKEELDSTTNEANPLGMLAHFGMMWNPEEEVIYVHDTYDFPKWARMFTGNRPKEMKIRGRVNFNPKKGSKLLRDNMVGFYDYPDPVNF